MLETVSVPDKWPIGVCLLEKGAKYAWDVISETNYRQIKKFEVEDAQYPPGGYSLSLNTQGVAPLLKFSSKHDIEYICFYYKTTGEILCMQRHDDLSGIDQIAFNFAVL